MQPYRGGVTARRTAWLVAHGSLAASCGSLTAVAPLGGPRRRRSTEVRSGQGAAIHGRPIDTVAAIGAADDVLAANQAFYDAFEARDIDAMSDVWERSDRATCTHPGWSTLRGWGKVASSFFTLFTGPQRVQFVLTDAHVEVEGRVGWVSLDENLLGDQGGATVA